MRVQRVLLLALAACALAAAAPPQPLLAITLYEGGLARVDAFVPTGGNVSVAVPLLGRLDPSLGVLVVDEWGEPLAYAVNEALGFIFVANVNSSLVRASYYTQDLTSKVGAVWSLNFTSPYRVRVALPENVTATWLGRAPPPRGSGRRSRGPRGLWRRQPRRRGRGLGRSRRVRTARNIFLFFFPFSFPLLPR